MSEREIIIRAFGKLFLMWSPVLVPIIIGLVIGIRKENEQERQASYRNRTFYVKHTLNRKEM